MVLEFTIVEGKIVAIDTIADPERLADLELTVLDIPNSPDQSSPSCEGGSY